MLCLTDDVMSSDLELEAAMFVKAESEVDDCKQSDEERTMVSCLRSNTRPLSE